MKLTTDFSDERAVSPVVGVILMVAITVILAAVIGTFVLDLGSDQTAPPRAGISFEEQSDGDFVATVSSAGNVDSLRLASGGSTLSIDYNNSGTASTNGDSNVEVGDSYTIEVGSSSSDNVADGSTVQVIGTNSGQEGIVAETTV